MPTINITLTAPVLTVIEQQARASRLGPSDYATRLIEDQLDALGLLSEDVSADIGLARSLVDRAVQAAVRIVDEEGFRSSITFDAIQAVTSDPDWLQDYRTLVRDDPFKTGSPLKQTINQNLGYFIKKALGAKSMPGANNRPANVKVKGSIIQSYTPLMM